MNSFFKIKKIISKVIDTTKLPDFLIKKLNSRIILGYHRILPEMEAHANFIQNCMWTSVENFEKQILWMKSIGDIVSLDMIIDFSQNSETPLFAITFDDGWKDNYFYALPILKKYNVPATIFLATDAVSTGKMFWPEEIYHKTNYAIKKKYDYEVYSFLNNYLKTEAINNKVGLKYLLDLFLEKLKLLEFENRVQIIKKYYQAIKVNPKPVFGQILTWDNIRNMKNYDITFGSHTQSHLILQGADRDLIYSELINSKQIIENEIVQDCHCFCYPNARYNNDDHELLYNAGYLLGVTLNCSVLKRDTSLYYLPRFIVYEDICKTLGYLKLRILNVPYY